ncbi:hypothetical protein [Parabacteroides gordonii]|uniref:hypothetical protein n=1 Tax=Parabacteroides gordonii TaxID=574930 RepID=UPI00350E5AB7
MLRLLKHLLQKQQKKKLQNNICNLYIIKTAGIFMSAVFVLRDSISLYLIFFRAFCAVALAGSIERILFQYNFELSISCLR